MFRILYVFLAVLLCSCAALADGDVNVARARWGATAEASSEFGPDYRAGNALDGRWASREQHKWNSRLNATPHWLRIDFGRTAAASRSTPAITVFRRRILRTAPGVTSSIRFAGTRTT